MSFLKNVLGTIIKQVAQRNQKNEAVKTADPVVFNHVQKKIENVHATPTAQKSQADILKEYFEQIKVAQVENEASPTVETADKSVYEDLVQEIEKLKSQVQNQNAGQPNLEMPTPKAPEVMMAWNSTGGTIEARNEPNMGADKAKLRIP